MIKFKDLHFENNIDIYKTGVYTIEFLNKPNLYYVGSTSLHGYSSPSANGFYSRWSTHFRTLCNRTHPNNYLQRIVDKHGISNLRFKILDIVEYDLVRYVELYWINILNTSNGKYGYNTGHVCLKNVRFKFSQKTKDKIGRSKDKKVLQYSYNGEFIKEHSSIKKIASELKIRGSSISDACIIGINNRKSCKGFLWRHSTDNYPLRIQSFYPEKSRDDFKKKKVAQFNIKTKELINIFESVTNVVNLLKCERSNLIRVLKRKYGGESGNYKGYYWEYCTNKLIIKNKQINKNTMEEITWGVPSATNRTRKEEQFTTPVLTMSALLKDGANRKFSFNKAAISALNLIGKESYIQVGFRGTELLVKNAGVVERDEDGAPLAGQVIPNNSFLLAGNNSFSDKKTFEFIIKLKELNTQVENHLHLEQVEGQSYFTVSRITSDHHTGDQLLEEISNAQSIDELAEVVNIPVEKLDEVIDEVISEIPGVTTNEEVVDLDVEENEDWSSAGTIEVEPVIEKVIIKPVVKKATPIAKAEPKPTAVKFAIDNTEDDGFSDTPVVNTSKVEDDGFSDITAAIEDEEVW